ncbi:hypothetical protein AAU61_03755 [Desulfocarbo indianensis]|nr:hypothetical protein AAU61_03755 [Desulfocarbo indianensis]
MMRFWGALTLFICLVMAAGAQAQDRQPGRETAPSAEQERQDGQPSVEGGESYLERQQREKLLSPNYKPWEGALPGQDENQQGVPSRPGAKSASPDIKPLPSPLEPYQRRKKSRALQTPAEETGPAPSGPAGAAPLSLATSRLSREGMYRVSYSGGAPNSHGVPFAWQVRVTDTNGVPVRGASLSLRLGMPGRGYHPVITGISVRELGGGLYQVSGLRCDRSGVWRVSMEVHGRGQGDTVEFAMRVP